MKRTSSDPKNKRGAKQEVRVSRQPNNTKFEIRTDPKTGTRTVAGYFAVFNVLSKDLGFREKLLPGCFSESLKTSACQCLFNHDASKLLGRTESKTLEVWEDDKGLAFRVTLPDTSYANDLVELLLRNDAFECSFGFMVRDGGDQWSQMPDGTLLRVISRAEVFEGSILVSPAAYPDTQASLRSLPKALRAYLDDSDCDPDVDDDCEDTEDRCDCACEACQSGNCDDCSDAECDDESCEECPNQGDDDLRSLKKHLAISVQRARLSDLESEGNLVKAYCLRRLEELDAKT